MGQVTLVCVRNPFDPHGSREIRVTESGKTIAEHIAQFYPEPPEGYFVTVSVDGIVRSDALECVTLPGQSVVFCATPRGGDGKNPLAIIGALALMVVTAGYAAPLAGAIGVGGAVGTAVVSAGMLTVGGLIISSVFPTSIPDTPGAGSFEQSSTYAWEPGGNVMTEGGPLPEIFGTHRVTPPIIGKYIETLGDKQYLNVLYAVAGHLVNSISSVRINETALESFAGVSYETRLGAVTQPVLQYFGDTRTDVAVGAKLNPTAAAWDAGTTYAADEYCTYGSQYWQSLQAGNLNNTPVEGAWWTAEIWTLRTTTGNTVEGIGVGISLPAGLFHIDVGGDLEAQTVKLHIEYSISGADDWTRLQGYNTTESTATLNRWSAGAWVQQENALPDVWYEYAAGSATSSDHTEGDPYETDLWYGYDPPQRVIYIWRWIETETIQQVGTVLSDWVEITAAQSAPIHRMFYMDNLASGQYDIRVRLVEALPSAVEYGNDTYFESFQEIIYDDFSYPGVALLAVRALATDQLSGAMPRVDCLVTRSTVIVWTGAGYEQLSANNPAWACYHLLFKGGYGGVPIARIVYSDFSSWADYCDEKGYTVNLYIDSAFSMRRALDMIGLNGRGTVVQRGSKFSCIVDRPEVLPVQRFLFTVGNIIKDSFSEEFLPMESRANAIEVTYFDADEDYSRQVVSLYAVDFDTSDREINTIQVTLYGCTSRALAIAYGQFLINCNRYLTVTGSWDADVDALACIPGDVIEVAHDVPQWGYSGRVISGTLSEVTIDRFVLSYVLDAEAGDGAYTEPGTDGASTDVLLSGALTEPPAGAYQMEAGKTYQVTVKHADDTRETRTVTAANLIESGFYSEEGVDGFVSTIPLDGFQTTTDIVTPTGYNEFAILSVSPPWSVVPSKYDLYSFGETNLLTKKMRIARISRSQEMRRKLVCIEHVDEVYEAGVSIPAAESMSDLDMVSRLVDTEVFVDGVRTSVALMWGGFALSWNVFYKRSTDSAWTFVAKAYTPSYIVTPLDPGVTYYFAVSATMNPLDGETTVP